VRRNPEFMSSEQETSQRVTQQPHILKRYLNLEKLLWTNSKSKELVNPVIREPTHTHPVFEHNAPKIYKKGSNDQHRFS
jgi:hypothetical protein